MKIVVLDSYSVTSNDIPLEFLEKYDATIYETTPPDMIVQRIKDADIVFTNKCNMTKEVIEKAPKLKYISEMATGFNNIDIDYCNEKNILVTNVPSYASDNVSEMVFAYLLDVFYNLKAYDDAVKDGQWISSKDFMFYKHSTHNLAGKTIGIIGYGGIGKEVEKKAEAFNMKVLVHRKHNDSSDEKFVSLDYLLQNSDIVTIHVPLNSQTKHMINRESLNKMKKSAVLINTARGPVVDQDALAEALNNDKIAFACIDVIDREPMEETNPLLKAKNIMITPHIGWAAYETRLKLVDILKRNLDGYLNSKVINNVTK